MSNDDISCPTKLSINGECEYAAEFQNLKFSLRDRGRKEAIVRPSERSYLHGFYAILHMILLEIYVITYKLINY